jgi:hypothetical protein
MYAWIWRHLPFGLPGKIIGSAVLVLAAVALLWFVVFPWAEPLLPFDDVQLTDNSGDPGGPLDLGPPAGDPGSDNPGGDGHDLPYSTDTNNPEPAASR